MATGVMSLNTPLKLSPGITMGVSSDKCTVPAAAAGDAAAGMRPLFQDQHQRQQE
jgi:hypothetical protein